MTKPPEIMMIAGEASGDTLGAELASSLRQLCPGVSLLGAAGPRMQAAGVRPLLDLTEHAVVGIIEVLKNYRKFKTLFDRLLEAASQQKPDAIVLIDYPGFNLRFCAAIKKRIRDHAGDWQPKIIYYVSPQIWAWHESRIEQMARDIDLLLAIFPFEKSWYAARKPAFRVEFVGHPMIDRYHDLRPVQRSPKTTPCVLLLPGSRVRELRKHLPPMIGAVRSISRVHPIDVRLVVPSDALRVLAEQFLPPEGIIQVQVGGLPAALALADIAIASSGTVTFECAYFGVPTVVIYRTSWSTYFLGRRFIRVKYLAMPNLLADEEVFPELIQQHVTGPEIASAALGLLQNSTRRDAIREKLRAVIASLGRGGASQRAAQLVLGMLRPTEES